MHSLVSSSVLGEQQQAGLISSEECKGLDEPSDVVRVQRRKSLDIQTKTAEILMRHGFEEESKLLVGKQTQSLIHVPLVCCTVEASCRIKDSYFNWGSL